jgi:hypothetical protein
VPSFLLHQRNDADKQMMELTAAKPGYLGVENDGDTPADPRKYRFIINEQRRR